MIDTPAKPEPVECVIFLALDDEGNYAATEDGAGLADAASHLVPGYRVIQITVTARPPVDTMIDIVASDAPPADATATPPRDTTIAFEVPDAPAGLAKVSATP